MLNNTMTIDILGTPYTILIKTYDEDESFAKQSIVGYCGSYSKQIVICDVRTCKDWENESDESIEACNKETMRHEIIHAFLHESGMKGSANAYSGSWAMNEEMIDWFAIQGPKINEAWKQADCV